MERTMPHIFRNQMLQACAGLTLVVCCAAIAVDLAATHFAPSLTNLAVLVGVVLSASVLFMPANIPFSARRIVDQLTRLGGSHTAVDSTMLEPLASTDELSRGWTNLVHHLKDASYLKQLDQTSIRSNSQNAFADGEILNTLSEGIGVTDINGRIEFLNNAMAALLSTGEEAEELLEASLLELLPEDTPERICDIAYGPQPLSFESETMNDDQKTRLRWSRRPKLNANGELNGHVWVVRDVTQQKMAEDMREQFVATATHELRTPLSNITAYAETLTMADDIDVEQQKNFYNIIQSEATRLSRFVDELLNVSRMEAGSMTLDKRETDIERLLNEVCDKVRPEIQRKKIDFSISFPPKLPQLTVDKDKLAAALVNLIGNAVKYTPDNGTVKFAVEQSGDEIRFVIEDTGIGIAEDEIPKLFDKFFRSDDSRVREITGSGLGLSFTNEVAKLHRGRIDITSQIDEGSTFTLVLPVSQGARQ